MDGHGELMFCRNLPSGLGPMLHESTSMVKVYNEYYVGATCRCQPQQNCRSELAASLSVMYSVLMQAAGRSLISLI